ncbi:MAG: class I SAM-dependent methyltransferase [Pseudomonadota bacterium]
MTASRNDAGPVERGWDEAALGYDAYFAPRFAPYLGAAIGALTTYAAQRGLPEGALLVPCVGPGRELTPLAHAFPGRAIIGSDLSTQMVTLASDRTRHLPNVTVERADALQLSAPASGVAALFSVFGLQLLPEPVLALRSWLGLLNAGGVAVIVYWPRDTEPTGPFFSMHQALREAGIQDRSWEAELVRDLPKQCVVQADVPVQFELSYENARSVWQALTELGPLRALANARGPELIVALGERFVREQPAGPLTHTPEARLLVITRAGLRAAAH